MVQIHERPMNPATQKLIDKDLSPAFEGFFQNIMGRQQREDSSRQAAQQMQQENAALKQLTGQDFTGVTDPKQRQEAFKQAFQAKQEQDYLQKLRNPSQNRGQPQESTQGQRGGIEDLSDEELVLMHGSKQGRPIAQAESRRRNVGGVSAKSVPQEYVSSMEKIIKGSAAANADELKLKMDAAGIPPTFSNSLIENRRKMEEKSSEFEKDKQLLERKESFELVKPVLQQIDEVRKNIPIQENAIQEIKDAAGDVGALDYFADVTGFEPLRSAAGAQMKTGIKDFFLSDLTRAGARPNQWIEQQLADALPKIGRSAIANKITTEGLQFKVDLAKKRIEIIDRLADEDRGRHGFVKPDIDSRATKEMKEYVVDRQKELAQKIKDIKKEKDYEPQKKYHRMIDAQGQVWDILTEDLEEASENGFRLAD